VPTRSVDVVSQTVSQVLQYSGQTNCTSFRLEQMWFYE
jgi:hypothetical protein